jgi:hypothetical protein
VGDFLLRKLALLVAASAILAAGQAGATVLFNQTLDNTIGGGGWSHVGGQRFADPVSLAADSTVDQVTWYGAAYFGLPFATFDVDVYSDASGAPGASVAHRSGTATATATALIDAWGAQVYAFTLDVAPIAFSGGTTYHVSIADEGDYNMVWALTSDACCGTINFGGPAWSPSGVAHAFALLGTADSAPTGGVPEPAAWALMLSGFFGMGAVIRGQRRARPA